MFAKLKLIFDNSDFSEIIKKASSFLFFRFFAFFFAYYFAIVIIKHYGADSYGLVTLSFTVLMIISIISKFGFDVSLIKNFSISNNKETRKSYLFSLKISLSLALICCLVLYGFSDKIAIDFFDKPTFSSYLKWTAFSIPLWTFLLINIGVFRGMKRVALYCTLDNFGRFFLSILFLLIVVTYYPDFLVYNPLMFHFFGLLVLSLISLYFIFRVIDNKKNSTKFDSKLFLKNSLPIMLSSTIVISLSWADKLFLGVYATNENIGIYDISIRIATLITFNLEAINSILSSKISKYYHEKKHTEFKSIIQFSTRLNAVLTIIVFLGIICFSEHILGFFGKEFLFGKKALIILALGQLFNSFCGPVGNVLQMTGYQKDFRNILAITLVLNIVLNFLLIPKMGINGAAISTSICLVFWNLVGTIFIRKKLKVDTFFNPFI